MIIVNKIRSYVKPLIKEVMSNKTKLTIAFYAVSGATISFYLIIHGQWGLVMLTGMMSSFGIGQTVGNNKPVYNYRQVDTTLKRTLIIVDEDSVSADLLSKKNEGLEIGLNTNISIAPNDKVRRITGVGGTQDRCVWEDPEWIRDRLAWAIANEKYEEAAECRDALKKLDNP